MNVVPFLAMAVPFYGIHFIAVFSFYVTKKTNLILFCYIFAFILNIVLNIVLIPILGIYGSAISYYLSYLFLNIILYYFSKRQYFIKFEWLKIFLMTLVAGLLIIPFFTFQIESRIVHIVLKLIAVAIFPFILLPIGCYEPIEVQKIKGFVKKYIKRS